MMRERVIDAALVVSILFLAVALSGCQGHRWDKDPWCDFSVRLCQ